MKTCDIEYLRRKKRLPGARRLTVGHEALNGDRSPYFPNNPILDFVRQLDSDGARFSIIGNGENGVEGVLLTVSSVDRVLQRLRVFCRERFLRCDIESRGPGLSVAILSGANFRHSGEVFSSQYGDFAGIRFPI
jgi:hypothetical protein